MTYLNTYPPAPPTVEWAKEAQPGSELDAICAYYMGWLKEKGVWNPPGLAHYRSSFYTQEESPNYSGDWRLSSHLMAALLQAGHAIKPEEKPLRRYAANSYAKLAVARLCAEVVAKEGYRNLYNPYGIG